MELSDPRTAPAHAKFSSRPAGCKRWSSPCAKFYSLHRCAIRSARNKGEPSGSPFCSYHCQFWLFGLAEISGHGSDKLPTRSGRHHIAFQDGGERYVMTVKGTRIICVLVDNSSVQVDTREQPLAARISQQFRLHRQVGR